MTGESLAQPRRVVVTGAASGIGRAVCALLVKEGAQVITVDVNAVELSALRKELGNAVCAQIFDVTEVENWQERVADWEEKLGPIDGLVCSAGRLGSGRLCEPGLSVSAFRAAFELHTTALWAAVRALAPRMSARGSGSIVAITSNAGSTPRLGMGAYPASKAAANMLVRCLALELGPQGIRVNAVAPGSTATPMLKQMLAGRETESLIAGDLASFRTGIPLGRIAEPVDVAQAVSFLLSAAARHITGIELTVDGGATWG